MTAVTRERVRVVVDGVRIDVGRREIRAVSIHAVSIHAGAIVDGIVRYLTLDHEAGDLIETSERDEGWAKLLEGLPDFLGFDAASLRDALDRSEPHAEPIVVFAR